MERFKSLISPRTRRKKLELAAGDMGDSLAPQPTPKTFGVSLEELMARAPPHCTVPPAVSRICCYIYKHGLEQLGLFRVSGSVRVVERFRMQFELTGDVNLEEENDVAAAAGLLKVFLRDLPETLIPARLTQKFFSCVKNPQQESVREEFKKALSLLPDENYNVLKYISSFLVMVAAKESENKMSPYALAIIFGPNIFKCELSSNMEGLRDMDSSKEVMQLFISDYNYLFLDDGEPTPQEFWDKETPKKSPPPRPPPPKISSPCPSPSPETSTAAITTTATTVTSSSSPLNSPDYRPVPSPRKIKNIYDSSLYTECEEKQIPVVSIQSSVPLFSPREDVDHTRAVSPFALESESHSIIESPMITARTSEFVEKTIVETISEHIFGGLDFNQNSGQQSPTSPLKTMFDDVDLLDGSPVDRPSPRQRSSIPNRSGNSISLVAVGNGRATDGLQRASESQLSEFDDLQRSDVLSGVKKPLGPPRRSPSRKHRRSWEGGQVEAHPQHAPLSDKSIVVTNGTFQSHTPATSSPNRSLNHLERDEEKENEAAAEMELWGDNDNSPSRKVWAGERKVAPPQSLGDHNSQDAWPPPTASSAGNSSGASDWTPTNTIKLFIPPLDFSTLHEHIDGVEPIPISKEQTDPQLWMKKNQLSTPDEDNVAVISPRSNKLKKRNGRTELDVTVAVSSMVIEAPMSPSAYSAMGLFRVPQNTDIPPSPPIEQDQYKKHSDDDCSHRLRQLTKKIQGLKRKIKHFEEHFEKEHGFRPSQGEKAAQPEIKKSVSELSKARKELKRLKEDTEKGNRSRHNSGASTQGVEMSPPVTPTVASTLDFILKCLVEKRQEAGRPEEVMLMSREQVHEEKLAVQRALLHFEGLHGRPSTKEDKDVMRPLYDRYRAVKRMLAKPVSPRNSLELQTVPEDQMMEIPREFMRNAIHVPTADIDDESINTPETGTLDFALVTRDFAVLRDIDLTSPQKYSGSNIQDTGWPQADDAGSQGSEDSGGDAHLHEMSLSELHVEIEYSRGSKKKLRRILREFEDDFMERHGRKVMKEDRHPLFNEYNEYKKVKARLRLLEALVLKHHE